jgi:hypothetical protein
MMHCLFLGLTATAPTVARADLFDTARGSLTLQAGQADRSGFSVRGGANLQSGQRPNSVTLLRASARMGGG